MAPTGSGKSTRAAPALLDLVPPQHSVLLLQPRRAAARMLARRIAAEQGCAIGDAVGYRVRFDQRVSSRTRLEVLTEGLLTRRLQDDPFLDGTAGWGRPVGAVVLDELHERSLHTDLALALLREVQDARPELVVLAMSATLDPAPVAAFLGGAAIIRAQGQAFPVQIEHEPIDLLPGDARICQRVAAAARRALDRTDGDVLCFLPGVREIQRCQRALADLPTAGVDVLPLHGRLPAAEQDRALRPGDRRRVVLSTNIAETSVTIPGITGVVDSGWARRPRIDLATGIERLHTVLISQASADQRSGRAGRTAPGLCLRLWSEHQHQRREPADLPELSTRDLSELALSVAAWGSELSWLDRPPRAAWTEANELLRRLGAVDDRGITPLGQQLARLPLHPRTGRILLAAAHSPQRGAVAALIALLTEADPWPRSRWASGVHCGIENCGVEDRVTAVLGGPLRGADPNRLAGVRRVHKQLLRQLDGPSSGPPSRQEIDLDALLPALLTGMPERLAWRREPGGSAVLLASGRGAEVDPTLLPRDCRWLVALDLHLLERAEPRVTLAAALSDQAVAQLPLERHRRTRWDEQRQAVFTTVEDRFMALTVRAQEVPSEPAEAAACLTNVASLSPTRSLFPSPKACALVYRLIFLKQADPKAADLAASDAHSPLTYPTWDTLDDALRSVLPALCQGRRRLRDLQRADVAGAILSTLDWRIRQRLDQLAPSSLTLPTGRQVGLDYDPLVRQGGGPVLRARMQQLFGLRTTPTVLGGRLPVTLHLLAPNNRPAQITTDLAGFWERTWPELRRDLRGRYPRHAWPEDPIEAQAEDRPRRKR